MFFSDKDEEVVRKMLKDIEQRSGRRPEDKKEEKVSNSGAKHIEENDSVSSCLAKVKFSFLFNYSLCKQYTYALKNKYLSIRY